MFKIVEDYFVKSGVGSMYSSTPSTGKSSARKPKCELPVEPNMSKQKMHSAAKSDNGEYDLTDEIFYFATHFKKLLL